MFVSGEENLVNSLRVQIAQENNQGNSKSEQTLFGESQTIKRNESLMVALPLFFLNGTGAPYILYTCWKRLLHINLCRCKIILCKVLYRLKLRVIKQC